MNNIMLTPGNNLEYLGQIPGWSEDDSNIYFSLEIFNFSMNKSKIVDELLDQYEILESLAEAATSKGFNVYHTYKDLPFANLLESKKEQHLTDYILTGNAAFTYDLIKAEGVNGLYAFISRHALNAVSLEKKLIAEGKGAIMFEYVQEELFRGVQLEYENEQPLIIDFEYKDFTITDGNIEYTLS